jgi:hypothetical protein
MRNLDATLLILVFTLIFFSCKKNEIDLIYELQNQNNEQNELDSDNLNDKVLKSEQSGYSLLSCDLPNGETGCECTPGMEYDCSPESPCTAQSSYPTYSNVLHQMFSEEEIAARGENKVRIIEEELRDALRSDGLNIYD